MSEFAVKVENLTKTYDSLIALNDVSFEVKAGDFFGIIGPNGAGKTTLLKILYSFVTPSSGIVNVSGFDLNSDYKKIKNLLGVVPQEDNLDEDLSVFENLMVYSMYFGIPRKESLRRAEELLGFFDLSEKKRAKVISLSGGLRRRLLIARALVNGPGIIILDEPTMGLDPEYRHNIWNKLKVLNKSGVTVLMSTHYMDEAERLFKNIIMLNHGKIVVKGDISDVLGDRYKRGINETRSLEEIFLDMVKK